MVYKKLEDLPNYGEQDVDYENPFCAYTPCRDSILQMVEDGVYESIGQGLCEINGFERLASHNGILLDMDSWIFITNPIYQSDKKNHLRYVTVKDDENLDKSIAEIGNLNLTDGNWEMERHNGYRLYVNKQDWTEFVQKRKGEMSKYANEILGRDLKLKDIIPICKKCDYCDVAYFYNEETKEYDKEFLTCNIQYGCEYKKYWE